MSNKFETFGKYVLLEKLATGGMAEVFLARGSGASGIAKFFAIKRILPQFNDSPEFIEMFKDEAKIAINLSHSNIVSIHEFDIKNNQFFIVMDYVEGRNLRQILNKMKKGGMQFSIDQIVFLIKEVAAGLDHAHRCLDGGTGKPLNITHRDMSPQNVMVSFEGEVKIVDFGIAKAESQIETTRAGTLKGKFGYMSPEQAEGQAVDLRTDIFSLGIVLWELLANDRLFMANNEINTLRKIRDCQIPSLRKINPNIHSELERIVMKALARDRNLRYQTCAALHRDLNRFLNRQFPDFAPQDFAVFIKSVFADEILSLRKRLVEFTKINPEPALAAPGPSQVNQETQKTRVTKAQDLINTQTNSLISSSTDSQIEIPDSGVDLPSAEDTPPPVTLNPPPIDRQKLQPPKLKLPDIESDATVNMQRRPPSRKEPSFNQLSDISSLEIPEVTSPSISRNTALSRFSRSAPMPKERKSFQYANLVLAVMLFSLGYIGLVKTMPSRMSQVVATTDRFIAPVHRALGIQNTFETASISAPDAPKPVAEIPTQSMPTVTAPTNPEPIPTQAAVAPTATAPIEPPSAGLTAPIVITSTPSGAEIFIDGENTGLITPTRLQVPSDRKFDLKMRKKGYLEFTRVGTTRSDIGMKLNANLVKTTLAYLDIDVIPPTQVTLFVNGQAVQGESLPLRNYPVSAESEVRLRAMDANQNESEEVTVRIAPNKRKHVQLFLKKRH